MARDVAGIDNPVMVGKWPVMVGNWRVVPNQGAREEIEQRRAGATGRA
ncbi:MAG: hypothetical protein M0004_15780 [Actinomycetota bacterium]|nr:hypothetical protein [Actinomycetota bacterium]